MRMRWDGMPWDAMDAMGWDVIDGMRWDTMRKYNSGVTVGVRAPSDGVDVIHCGKAPRIAGSS